MKFQSGSIDHFFVFYNPHLIKLLLFRGLLAFVQTDSWDENCVFVSKLLLNYLKHDTLRYRRYGRSVNFTPRILHGKLL